MCGMKKRSLYEWSVALFFVLLPFAAIWIDLAFFADSGAFAAVAFKWFVFSGIGLRLGSSGVKQIIRPQFTAEEIFNIKNDGAAPIVRELGFANVCFAALAVTSLFVPGFRVPAAITGGLYFGFAGLLHIFKPKAGGKEIFAMVSDLYIFTVLLILTVWNLL
jgi:predicted phage tail protein